MMIFLRLKGQTLMMIFLRLKGQTLRKKEQRGCAAGINGTLLRNERKHCDGHHFFFLRLKGETEKKEERGCAAGVTGTL